MRTLADVFRELKTLKADDLVRDYCHWGCDRGALLRGTCPDLRHHVFVVLAGTAPASLVSLERFYEWARMRGFPADAEHILVHGVPVQFLPAHNALAESAVTTARTLDYDGVPVRVIDPEHLVALAFQAGGHKRRERAWQMIEVGAVNRQRLRELLSAHGLMMEIDDGP
jgi:hypothetical protein